MMQLLTDKQKAQELVETVTTIKTAFLQILAEQRRTNVLLEHLVIANGIVIAPTTVDEGSS